MNKCINKKNNSAYISLVTTLIVSTIVVAAIQGSLLLSVDSANQSIVFSAQAGAFANAESCAETALQSIRDDQNTFGPGSTSVSNGSCSYEIIDTGLETREIQSTGVSGNSTQRVLVTITTINPQILINNWVKVSSF